LSRWIVESVAQFSRQKAPDSICVRPNAVKTISTEPATLVYNLQVKNVPEYYANGILVHNCQMMFVGGALVGTSLTIEQKVAMIIPQSVKDAIATPQSSLDNWKAQMCYESALKEAEDAIGGGDDEDGYEGWD